MKKLIGLICGAGLLIAVSAQADYDGHVQLQNPGSAYGNALGGGVFDFKVVDGLGSLVTDPNGHFQTFCIEYGEHISWGGTYGATINPNEKALNGGVTPAGVGDPLSEGSAWLYSQFRAGTLANYNNDAKSANALQAALWWLEGEANGSDGTGAAAGSYQELAGTFLQEARTALGIVNNGVMQAQNAAYAEFGVVVLNLYNADGSVAQDQLGLVPEPSTVIAGALLLLPFGVSTIRIVRKNRTT